MTVLKPLNRQQLEELFDKRSLDVLRFFIKKAMIAQPEILVGQIPRGIQVPKEHIEQWIVQAIGGKPVGAGSYPIDIVHGTVGIDVKMLAAKTKNNGELSFSDSGETSLAQKFTDSGENLDDLFKNEKNEEIIEGWKRILYNKLNEVVVVQALEKVYYFFILRSESKIHLCAAEVNLDQISQLKMVKRTESSIFLQGLIDPSFGNAKIYKAKKRLELRLKPRHWYECGYTLDFDLDFEVRARNIRELMEYGTLYDYKKELCKFLMDEE